MRLAMDETKQSNLSATKVAAVIVAAGRGERAGQSTEGPKQYRRIGGCAVLYRTIEAFSSHPSIGIIVVAIHPDDTLESLTARVHAAEHRLLVDAIGRLLARPALAPVPQEPVAP